MFKTTYPNIDISVLVYCVCRTDNSQSLTDFLKYLLKNIFFLSPKIVEKKNCQNTLSAFLRRKKKKSREWGAKGLSGLSTKKYMFFCGFPKEGRKELRN